MKSCDADTKHMGEGDPEDIMYLEFQKSFCQLKVIREIKLRWYWRKGPFTAKSGQRTGSKDRGLRFSFQDGEESTVKTYKI